MIELTKHIKTKSLELGFDLVGITSPNKKIEYFDYYEDWLSSGKNGTMKWMERRNDERKEISRYFPGVKSIIVVGINYYTGDGNEIVAQGSGEYKFSNYAWGIDYHKIVKDKLSHLMGYINDELSASAKGVICVDTSPVMEKQWAKQAGLGWQGKNTLVLNKEYGSWLFLGELLLDIQLEYDEPFVNDLCGNCNACIDACSVNALSDYQLDASKCISYLSVEYKEEFDDHKKNGLSSWIYGCDTCQQVCPWNNKNLKYSHESSFQPIKEVQNYSLNDWLEVDEPTFIEIFGQSPVKRLKHRRFLRNVNAVKESRNNVD